MRGVSGSVMAVYEFHGDPAEMAARYDDVLRTVVAVSPGRPVVHLAALQEWGLMVIDVWTSAGAFAAFDGNADFRRVLAECGLPEPVLRTSAVHNTGWPAEALPLYR